MSWDDACSVAPVTVSSTSRSPNLQVSFTSGSPEQWVNDTSASYGARRLFPHLKESHNVNILKRRHKLMVGAIALTLVAAACGGDDSGDNNDTTTTAAAEVTTTAGEAATTTAATGETTEAPATTEGGSATSAPDMGGEVDYSKLSGTLDGSGATFPKVYYDEAIAEFASVAPDVTVNYAGGGSGKGRTDLQEQVVDFAGTDGVVKAEDVPKYKGGEFVYVPTVIAPITVSYNLEGVDELHLTAPTIAKIFQAQITSWDDPAIVAENEGVELPAEPITVVHRADGSGTTENFSKFLEAAVGPEGTAEAGVWTLGTGSELEWPASTLGGDGNSGVAQLISQTAGSIGYVDLSDAMENGLVYASVQNKAGEFVQPTPEAASAAAAGAKINDDLTFFVGWADGAEAYPIAAQTWIIAYVDTPADQAEVLRGFLTYLVTDAQELTGELGYAPLPADLQAKALANIAKIGA
jgi:phosphate transport system substrate-binding protein